MSMVYFIQQFFNKPNVFVILTLLLRNIKKPFNW